MATLNYYFFSCDVMLGRYDATPDITGSQCDVTRRHDLKARPGKHPNTATVEPQTACVWQTSMSEIVDGLLCRVLQVSLSELQ